MYKNCTYLKILIISIATKKCGLYYYIKTKYKNIDNTPHGG